MPVECGCDFCDVVMLRAVALGGGWLVDKSLVDEG